MAKDGLKTPKKYFNKLVEKMKANKKVEIAIYAGLILVGVLIYISTLGGGKKVEDSGVNDVQAQTQTFSQEREIEERLKAVLSCIRGAGKVEVMILFDTGKEIVPAMSTNTQVGASESVSDNSQTVTENRTESSAPATMSQSGGNQPIVLTEKQPTVRGVIVIAEGAADFSVRVNLQNAVKTVLGIELSYIEVFEMKSSDGE